MIFCLDMDGVLCRTEGTDYEHAVPDMEVIRRTRALADAGHTILIYTARGQGTGKDWGKLTYLQLLAWNVPYTKVYFTKPAADVYVDDRMQALDEFRKG